MENSSLRIRIISILVLGALIGVSIWFGCALASSESFHHKDIVYLEEKQNNAKALSASASTASVLISLLPQDTATPLANQISNVGRDFMIILSALSTERYLLTITGRATFCWLIPIGLGLVILFVLLRRKLFLQIGLKLAIAGCVIYMLVPVTLRITRMIDSSYEEVVGTSLEQSKEIQDALHFSENGILLPGMSADTVKTEADANIIPDQQAEIQSAVQTQEPNDSQSAQASSVAADARQQVQKDSQSAQASSVAADARQQVQKDSQSAQASSVAADAGKQAQKQNPEEELPWYEELWNGFTGIVSDAVNIASGFVETAANTFEEIGHAVTDAINAVSDMAATAVDEVADAGEKAIAAAEMIPQIPQMASNLLNSLIDAFVLMIVTTCVLPIAVLIGLLFVMNQVLITNFDWGKQEA